MKIEVITITAKRCPTVLQWLQFFMTFARHLKFPKTQYYQRHLIDLSFVCFKNFTPGLDGLWFIIPSPDFSILETNTLAIAANPVECSVLLKF